MYRHILHLPFGFLSSFDFTFGANRMYGVDQTRTGLCFIGMDVSSMPVLLPIRPIYHRFERKLTEAQIEIVGPVT